MQTSELSKVKQDLIAEIEQRVADRVLEPTNAALLCKLITQADNDNEAMSIAALGTTYKRTGLHFDKRLEPMTSDIRYFRKNEALSFHSDPNRPTHKLIIGDNYEALQNLLVQYTGAIDVIYIDPPYGKDSMGEFAQTNYQNAITRDNLLSMLYPRLQLAKQLLSDTGVIFCSIDDKNQAYLKCLFDEVFGEGNMISTLPTVMNLKGNQDEFGFAGTHEYTLLYAKDKQHTLIKEFEIESEDEATWQKDTIGYYKKGATLKRTGNDAPREKRPNGYYPILVNIQTKEIDVITIDEFQQLYNADKKVFNDKLIDELKLKYKQQGYAVLLPYTDGLPVSWRWQYEKVKNERDEIIVVGERGEFSLYKKQRPEIGDLPSKKPKSLLYKPEYSSGNGTAQHKSIFGDKLFGNPKPMDLIKDLIYLTSNDDSIILDFFAGSGTTGHAVLDLNRSEETDGDLFEGQNTGGKRTFILCQMNEKTDTTPNGIAYDVTAKRLKRIMTGECYDGTTDFEWIRKNKPYGGNLDVYELAIVSNFEYTAGKSAFEVIDETLYGHEPFTNLRDKIEWVCTHFQNAQRRAETDTEWQERTMQQ